MTLRGVTCSALALLPLFAMACGRGVPRIVIGSKNTTEESIVGEIVAQHVQRRLGYAPSKRPYIGGPLLAYQGLQSGDINVYPECTGTILAEILKEQPSANPDQALERAKGEMGRIAQAQLLSPLG